jgi:mycofactocin system glycosyltransferase
LRLDPGVRRLDEGRTILGGSPLRVVKLSPAGAAAVDGWAAGQALGASAPRRRLARRLLDGGVAHPAPGPEASLGGADVTVVVPVRDDAEGLAATLAALRPLAEVPVKVVVVDDGSSPPLPPGLDSPLPPGRDDGGVAGIVWLRHDRARGPAAARNTGLAAVSTPLVAFVDADVTPPATDWLQPLVAHFADEAVVAVAPRVRSRPTDGSVRDRFERRHSPLDLGGVEARVAPRTRVAYVPTAALIARRSAVEAVGAFDGSLRYGEDVDLVFRLVEAAGTVRYEPAVTVGHRPRRCWRDWWRQRVAYGTAAAPLALRHPGQVPPVAVSWWSLAAWSAGAAGHPVVGLALAAGSAALLPRKLRGVFDEPTGEGLRLALQGHAAAGRWIARAVTRTWWPAALALGLISRRARVAVAAAVVLPALLDWESSMGIDRVRYVAVRLADDVAYGAGVWLGCWRARTAAPLWPDLRSWPGRQAPTR